MELSRPGVGLWYFWGMRILIHHLVRLPATHYGGTERVILWLARGLQEMGHSVGIIAAPGSGRIENIEVFQGEEHFISSGAAERFDVTHFFTTPPPHWSSKAPVIATIEGNGKPGEKFHVNSVFVSKDHARRHGSDQVVYNGLDPDELSFSDQPRPDRFLFLSRTDWRVKNVRGAIRYAAYSKQNLWVAGGDGPFLPKMGVRLRKLFGSDWKWVGSVDQKQKADFLLQGKAMLFPVLWNEPFGLVMTEALVSGTPVFGPNYGSVPEVIGFAKQCVMQSDQDWVSALRGEIELPKARECRDWAVSQFHYKDMTKRYLDLYEKVLNGKNLNRTAPQTI